MDYKITKKRLNDHLSYDWIKYICIVLAAVLVWSLIFTMTGIRIPNNKTLSMYFILPGVNTSEQDTVQGDIADLLSDTVIDINISNWKPSAKETPQLIQTRFATQEGDIMTVDNMSMTGDPEKDKDIVSSFNAYVDQGIYYCLEDLIRGAIDYKFDEDAFRARVKKEKKFNKIDTEAQMIMAIVAEKVRIEDIKQQAIKLAGYLGIAEKLEVESSVQKIENLAHSYSKYTQYIDKKDDGYENLTAQESKVWGINFAEVDGKLALPKIKNLIWYANDTESEKDESAIREYAMGIIFAEVNMPYTYTYIKVLNYLIERYK